MVLDGVIVMPASNSLMLPAEVIVNEPEAVACQYRAGLGAERNRLPSVPPATASKASTVMVKEVPLQVGALISKFCQPVFPTGKFHDPEPIMGRGIALAKGPL